MATLTPEEELTFGLSDPADWHQEKHSCNGFCLRMMTYFSSHGYLNRLKWMDEYCGVDITTTDALDGAAANGFLYTVKWLYLYTDAECTTAAIDQAATHGHLKVVMWLSKHTDYFCTTAAMDGAASNGHLEVVKWLYGTPKRTEGCTESAMMNAAANGHLEIVQFLRIKLKQKPSNAAICAAAENGHFEVVKYLHSHRAELCTAAPVTIAVENGHGQVIEYLLKHRECRRAYCAKQCQNGLHHNQAKPSTVLSVGEEAILRAKVLVLIREDEEKIRAEEEAKIREEEGVKIRAEETVRFRAEEVRIRAEEETRFRESIRTEIRAKVVEAIRAEVRAQLLAEMPQKCPICQLSSTDSTTTSCGHTFCKECLSTWLLRSMSCPMCRSAIFQVD